VHTVRKLRQADRDAFLRGDVYPVKLPDGVTQQDFEKNVADWANRYNAPLYEPYFGPHSNSAAGFPLIMSGAQLPYVPGALNLDFWAWNKYPDIPIGQIWRGGP
jgi:hypothetical protein